MGRLRGVLAVMSVVIAAGCATASGPSVTPVAMEPSEGIPCNVDSECRGGVCRTGTCEHMPSAAAPPTRPCQFDSECPRGGCRAGTCVQNRANQRMCNFDADCPGGACRSGSCSGRQPYQP